VLTLSIGIPINIYAKLNICSLNAPTSPIPKPLDKICHATELHTRSFVLLRRTVTPKFCPTIRVSPFLNCRRKSAYSGFLLHGKHRPTWCLQNGSFKKCDCSRVKKGKASPTTFPSCHFANTRIVSGNYRPQSIQRKIALKRKVNERKQNKNTS
jgi:hypothetical protein